MKLSEAREAYYSYSGNASTVARQLAFAGIAVVWLFNTKVAGQPIALPHPLLQVAFLLVVTLAFDLLQYVSASLIWGAFARRHEKQIEPHRRNDDPDVDAPAYLNWPAIACFWLKLASLLIAYGWLATYLWGVAWR